MWNLRISLTREIVLGGNLCNFDGSWITNIFDEHFSSLVCVCKFFFFPMHVVSKCLDNKHIVSYPVCSNRQNLNALLKLFCHVFFTDFYSLSSSFYKRSLTPLETVWIHFNLWLQKLPESQHFCCNFFAIIWFIIEWTCVCSVHAQNKITRFVNNNARASKKYAVQFQLMFFQL